MKSISFWASKHIFLARIWLIGFKILFTISAFYLGRQLVTYDWLLPFYTVVFFLLIVLAGVYLFIRFSTAPHKKYWKRVIVTIFLSLCAAISFVHIASDRNFISFNNKLLAASSIETATIVPVNNRTLSENNLPVQIKNKTAFKKQLRKAIKKYKTEPTPNNKKRLGIMLIILSVIVFTGAIVGVAALSCNLGCSGYEAAAFLVGFLGEGLLIFLMILLFKKINKKYFPSKNKKTEIIPPAEET